jgi:hypothetical protein
VGPLLRNPSQLKGHRLNPGWRGPEHELMRLVSMPDLEPTLQSSKQSDQVSSRLFILKSLEQLAFGPPRLGHPTTHAVAPSPLTRVFLAVHMCIAGQERLPDGS